MHQQNIVFVFMAYTFIFLIFSIFSTVESQQRYTNISLSSSLTPTTKSSWLSRSGLFAFGFYKQGSGYAVGVFVAGIPEKTVVWTANRDDPPVSSNATLAFINGRLVLNLPQGQTTYIADNSQSIAAASMLDSGNFVLYKSDGETIWQSFDERTDTILSGQRLLTGNRLVSSYSETDHSTGLFRLDMQQDGNLVAYPFEARESTAPYAYYASGTSTAGENVTLNLDNNGHLYLLNTSGSNIRNLTQGESSNDGKIYRMTLDADGIFRVYSLTLDPIGEWSIMWNSSDNKCTPKGLCGLNGYCILIDTKADCICLPGFTFVNPDNWSSGCERNSSAVSCNTTNGVAEFGIMPLQNMEWEDEPYTVIKSSNKEDCEKSCLEDCNCEVALYKDGDCKKQKLPLRYGRRSFDTSQVAFIKEGKSIAITKQDPGTLPSKGTKKEMRLEIVLIIGASLITLALVVLTISGYLIHRNRVWVYNKISEKAQIDLGEDVVLRTFTFIELEQVTNGFQEELGRGASGIVYKGVIPYNQKVVAVKKLEKPLAEGEREFHREIKVIGRSHHRNLVQLIGYCLDGLNKLLVYEYMSNGSLADFLFSLESRPSWDERIGIAHDIARGILYLHEECETQIIHCDIKPQNILMDEHGRAKISDFGLAKLSKPDQTKTFTGIRGTRGYVAPEWHRKLPITIKADVYSFGVVLLEIICGRKCLDWSRNEDEAVLENWVYDCFEAGELGKLVGDEDVDKRKFERMVKVALWCIQDEPSLRPSMKKVLLMLEGTVDIPTPPGPTSFLSAI